MLEDNKLMGLRHLEVWDWKEEMIEHIDSHHPVQI